MAVGGGCVAGGVWWVVVIVVNGVIWIAGSRPVSVFLVMGENQWQNLDLMQFSLMNRRPINASLL